jgi:hypothetical protein
MCMVSTVNAVHKFGDIFPAAFLFPGQVLFLEPIMPAPEGRPRNPHAASRLVTAKATNISRYTLLAFQGT